MTTEPTPLPAPATAPRDAGRTFDPTIPADLSAFAAELSALTGRRFDPTGPATAPPGVSHRLPGGAHGATLVRFPAAGGFELSVPLACSSRVFTGTHDAVGPVALAGVLARVLEHILPPAAPGDQRGCPGPAPPDG